MKGLFAAVSLLVGQTISISSPGRSSADVLRDYGIDIAQPALVVALKNSNARVRMLAAHQLASDHDLSAVPAIIQALTNERDLMTRIGISTALASLNAPEGIHFLLETCASKDTPIRPAIASIQMIQMLGNSSAGCTGAMLYRLEQPDFVDYRDAIIPLLGSLYNTAQPDQASQIISSLQHLLADRKQQASVRMAAANALAEIGSPSSLSTLKESISIEKDVVVQAVFEAALKSLEHKIDVPSK